MGNVDVFSDNKISFARLVLSTIIAVIVSLGLILIFALLIKWFEWGDGVIAPVNIVIKILSIAVAVIIATKNGNKSLLKGAIVGAGYIILSYIAFSALLGSFGLSIENLWDLIFGIVVGGIIGIICNIVKK